jgi:hypothetical protein
MHDKFKELTEKYPGLGNAIIFSKLVKGRKMSRGEISKWFKELVPHQDWVGSPLEQLTVFYHRLSNGLE